MSFTSLPSTTLAFERGAGLHASVQGMGQGQRALGAALQQQCVCMCAQMMVVVHRHPVMGRRTR